MTDGNLPAALTHLNNALSALFQPQGRHIDSLYEQLEQAIPGTGNGNGHHTPGSSPPLNLDAVDLKNEIDTALTIWKLDQRKWRPQDTKAIHQATRHITTWTQQIRALLDPTPHKTLPNPCPECGQRYAYRHNSSGEYVRQGALQINHHGCECLKCHTRWPPEHFQLLAGVLGYPMPTGVLE
jgi:hypothetical protein